ncbi:MAG: hypothetical protein DKINENOH_00928 [bacterium]|nr:hypothetical protein [bacterium]
MSLERRSAVSITLLVLLAAAPMSAQPLQELRGVKLTNVDSQVLFSDANIAEAMDYLAGAGLNVVLPVVLNRGHTLYPSLVMDDYFNAPILPEFDGRDPLGRVLIEAHRNGLEVLPWFEYGFAASYSQNGGHILARYPDWALRDSSGRLVVKNGFDWMSAINPEVQRWMLALVTEILDHYDVDGIEFSDRIPALPVEGGYEAATVALYRAEHNSAAPPANFRDPAWQRWRADQLNAFYRTVRDSIKARGEHLLVSSSPSVYPWSYEEYLQDGKTWVEQGIVDNFIPQLYRYSFSDYLFELNKSLSYVPLDRRRTFYAGLLAQVGSYLITPEFLLACLRANRERNVSGEVFFFYEALRSRNNLLGDTLQATYYAQPALLPERNGQAWRPKATIVNEDEAGAAVTGAWAAANFNGFRGNVLRAAAGSLATISYEFNVPFAAWFGVYAYFVPASTNTRQARFTVFSGSDSSSFVRDQTDLASAGWQKIADIHLPAGMRRVLKLDNTLAARGENLIADAAMIMINRKLSPQVVVTAVAQRETASASRPDFMLSANYPNPFNAATRMQFSLAQASHVRLKLYDANGKLITTLIDAFKPAGRHEITWQALELASGLYLAQLEVGAQRLTRKLLLLR